MDTNNILDLDKLSLPKPQRVLLREIADKRCLEITDELSDSAEIQSLYQWGLIDGGFDSQFPPSKLGVIGSPNCYMLTPRGQAFVLLKRRVFWQEFRAWGTLAVAVFAFFLSILSLAWQMHTTKSELQEPKTQATTTMAVHVLTSTEESV